jgi:hypothetical protein
MLKRIKLMTDYCCFPLWDLETGDNLNPEDLPLSVQTKKKLTDWATIYDQILDWNNPILSGFKSAQEELSFEQQGWDLAIELQKELGCDYQVFWFSEINNQLMDLRKGKTE